MKKQQVVLVIIGFILLALMATNPSIEDHRQAVLEKMKERLSQASDGANQWEKVGQAIGVALGQGIVEKAVSRKNYLFFSATTISFKDNSKNIGFGVLGKVFLSNYNEIGNLFEENNSEKEIESEISIQDKISNQLEIINQFKSENDYFWIYPDIIGKDFYAFVDEFKKNLNNYEVKSQKISHEDGKEDSLITYTKEYDFQKFGVHWDKYGDPKDIGVYFEVKEPPSVIIEYYLNNGFVNYNTQKSETKFEKVFLSSLNFDYCLGIESNNNAETTIYFIRYKCENSYIKLNWFQKLIRKISF
jgi:hypothetical protein